MDLALLELAVGAPPGASPAPLRSGSATIGHPCVTYGYPPGHGHGVRSSPWIEGPAEHGWLQLPAQIPHSQQIKKGFSGSGLFDLEVGAVVGVVVTRDRDPAVQNGFAIPMQQVARAFPQLGPWVGWRLGTDRHLREHWSPRARGVYRNSTPGWYFTGRAALLRELVAWLENDRPGGGVRVVTGPAGTGKSAVLAWLAATADPQLRAEIAQAQPQALSDPDVVSAPGRISSAVWARDLDAVRAAQALAAALSVPIPSSASVADVLEAIRDHCADRLPGLVVLVDALDEAADPRGIARQLLTPLARDLRIKTLVATRPGRGDALLDALGPGAVIFRLDQPPYYERQDLVEYAAACLRLDFDPTPTEYRDNPPACALVAEAIVDAAVDNFLVAGLAARARAERQIIDTSRPDWAARESFPEDVGQAFDDYLARYGGDAQRARNLLRALAYVQGPGLPADHLWPQMANALASPRRYDLDHDVAWLLDHATDYLIETDTGGPQTAYRLFHEALADHLRTERAEQRNQQRLTQALLDTVLTTPAGGGWGQAHPYVRNHLATHAAAAGMVDQLLCDPDALFGLNSLSLLRGLSSAVTPDGRLAGEAYRRALPRLGAGTGALQLAALQTGAAELARVLADPERQTVGRWRASRAWWNRLTPSQSVAEVHAVVEGVRSPCLATCESELGPVALLSVRDEITSWDLESGSQLASVSIGSRILSLAACGATSPILAAVGDEDGRVTLLTVPELRLVSQQEEERADALSVEIRDVVWIPGSDLIASGDVRGRVKLWHLPDLAPVAERSHDYTSVESLVALQIRGQAILLSLGDLLVRNAPGRKTHRFRYLPGSNVRAWTIPELTPCAEAPVDIGHPKWMGAISPGTSAVVVTHDLYRSQVWSLDNLGGWRPLSGESPEERPSALIRMTGGDGVLCTTTALVPLHIPSDASGPLQWGSPVECDEYAVWAGPVTAHGQSDMLVSAGHALRLWSVQDVRAESTTARDAPLDATRHAYRTERLVADGHTLYAVTGSSALMVWEDGLPEPHTMQQFTRAGFNGMVLTSVRGTSHLAAGSGNGEIVILDAAHGAEAVRFQAGRKISCILPMQLSGGAAILAAVEVAGTTGVPVNQCRMWYAATGREVCPKPGVPWRVEISGWGDKRIAAVATWGTPEGPVLAAATCKIVDVWRLANVEETRPQDETRYETFSYVTALAGNGRQLVVGCADGSLCVWPMPPGATEEETGPSPWSVPAAHQANITSTAFGIWAGEPCIATGGDDGLLRTWRSTGEPLDRVELDAPVRSVVTLTDGRFAVGTDRGIVVIETDHEGGSA